MKVIYTGCYLGGRPAVKLGSGTAAGFLAPVRLIGFDFFNQSATSDRHAPRLFVTAVSKSAGDNFGSWSSLGFIGPETVVPGGSRR